MKTYTVGFKLFHGGRWMDVAKLKITLQILQQRLKTGNMRAISKEMHRTQYLQNRTPDVR